MANYMGMDKETFAYILLCLDTSDAPRSIKFELEYFKDILRKNFKYSDRFEIPKVINEQLTKDDYECLIYALSTSLQSDNDKHTLRKMIYTIVGIIRNKG